MKKIPSIVLIFNIFLIFSQEDTSPWNPIKDEAIQEYAVTQTKEFSIDQFTFKVFWGDKLSYSENLQYYGGIAKMEIYTNGELTQTLTSIEDNTGLGEVYFSFYDFNMDGFIDFTLPLECGKSCYYKYYLYDPKDNAFVHQKGWDYLQIQKINRRDKRLLSQPEGNALEAKQILYEVSGNQLKKLRTIKNP